MSKRRKFSAEFKRGAVEHGKQGQSALLIDSHPSARPRRLCM